MKRIYTLMGLFLSLAVFAQTLGSRLDKTTLALGEVGTYTVYISGLLDKEVKAAPPNELLPYHFEEISDSVSVTPERYERIVTFAVFEEGTYHIPALEFDIDGTIQKTIPYEVEVINTATKEDEISDIRNNKTVELKVLDYWQMYKWYIIAFIALIILIILIVLARNLSKKRKSSPVLMTNKTLKELDQLRKKKFIENGDYRSFYVELIDISRNFITRQYHIPADVLLTDDLIAVIKETNSIAPENEKVVEDVFLRGDMVKFAKTFPSEATMEKDFNDIREFVKKSAKDIEAEQLRTGV